MQTEDNQVSVKRIEPSIKIEKVANLDYISYRTPVNLNPFRRSHLGSGYQFRQKEAIVHNFIHMLKKQQHRDRSIHNIQFSKPLIELENQHTKTKKLYERKTKSMVKRYKRPTQGSEEMYKQFNQPTFVESRIYKATQHAGNQVIYFHINKQRNLIPAVNIHKSIDEQEKISNRGKRFGRETAQETGSESLQEINTFLIRNKRLQRNKTEPAKVENFLRQGKLIQQIRKKIDINSKQIRSQRKVQLNVLTQLKQRRAYRPIKKYYGTKIQSHSLFCQT